MRSSRCAFSTAAALRRVFILPIGRPRPSQIPHSQLRFAPIPHFFRLGVSQQRCYARPTTAPKRRLPRDDEIRSDYVQIVSEDGKLSPPRPTSALLQSVDRKNYIIVTVAVPARDRNRYTDYDGETDTTTSGTEEKDPEGPEFPIVKILERREFVAAEREKGKKKKSDIPSATVKKIELNWAIDGHDLGHRLERMKEFLRKGWRVEVMMAGKRKGRKATEEEAKALLAGIKGAMKEVEGGKEWKPMDGIVGTQATLFLEGKVAGK